MLPSLRSCFGKKENSSEWKQILYWRWPPTLLTSSLNRMLLCPKRWLDWHWNMWLLHPSCNLLTTRLSIPLKSRSGGLWPWAWMREPMNRKMMDGTDSLGSWTQNPGQFRIQAEGVVPKYTDITAELAVVGSNRRGWKKPGEVLWLTLCKNLETHAWVSICVHTNAHRITLGTNSRSFSTQI